VDEEVEALLEDGRKRHAVDTEQHSEFSTSWLYQLKTLWAREVIRHWRDPTYLLAKLALNVVAGLFVGFTFFKAKDSIQGTQNKIFVSRLLLLISHQCFFLAHYFMPTGRLHESSYGPTLGEPNSGRFL
jgi:ATP-binding cassette subfamily G (WHITE) protein 2 (SNQ2)